jgi:hypothetical protein
MLKQLGQLVQQLECTLNSSGEIKMVLLRGYKALGD